MKANYVKPSLKIKEIDSAESMLVGSKGNNNFVLTNEKYTGGIGNTNTTEVSSSSALSKQGSFLGNQWDDEE